MSRWRATVMVESLCMLAARADPDQKSLIISKVLVRLEAMARTKQTARVQPTIQATGEKKKKRTKRKREHAKRRKKKEESEETSTSEGTEGEETKSEKPKGAEKGDEEMEVLDMTADVSGGNDIEVNIRSQNSYFKIRFWSGTRKKEGKKSSHV